MQFTGMNWASFGWGLIAACVFGVVYASLVRWASKRNWVGQTAWSVVIGVTVTLLAMIPALGLNTVSLIFCFFAASGTPMIIEYLTRIQAEIQADRKKADELNRELLNGHETESRQ